MNYEISIYYHTNEGFNKNEEILLILAIIFSYFYSITQSYSLELDHTTILVKTLDKSTDFYRKILQLKELPALWGKTHWASFVGIGNNQQLHIAQVEADSVKLNKVHLIAFSVNNLTGKIN